MDKKLHQLFRFLFYSRYGLLLLLILLTAGFFRFYNLKAGMSYLGDEGRDMIIAREIITLKHWPLVGPPTSIGNLYLGPAYFYLVAPFLGLFNFEPLGPAVFIALLSILTVLLLYLITDQFFSSKAGGLVAAASFAFSPLAVTFGRWPWNPNVMPFFASLLIYSIWQVLEKKRLVWWPAVGLSLALVLQSHYLGLAGGFILFLALLIKKPKLKQKKYLFSAMAIFLLLMSPLLIFDLRHNFLNTKGFISIVQERGSGGFSLFDPISRSRDRLRQVFGEFTGFGERSLINNLLLVFLAITWFIWEKKKKRWWLAGLWLLGGVLFLGLYQGPFYQHYLEFIFPAVSLVLGGIVAFLWRKQAGKWLTMGLVLSLLAVFVNKDFRIISKQNIPGVETTKEIVKFINQKSGNQDFNFSLLATNNYDSAYRYFFELWKMPAVYNEVTKQLFVVCEGNEVCQPEGNPKWEIAVFDAAYDGKIEKVDEWQFYDYFKIYHFKPRLGKE